MILPDVNVLVYALREELPDHDRYRAWLDRLVNGTEPFAINDLVLSGVIRVSTNPRAFTLPTPIDRALEFVDRLRSAPTAVVLSPGPKHWSLFLDLCRVTRASGNLVPDAFFAALAIEHGAEWATTDRDYAKFPNLKFLHPLA